MKISVRLWQTALFVTVILVGMLILSARLFGALETTVLEAAGADLERSSAELSRSLGPLFPPTRNSPAEIRDAVNRFFEIFEYDAWVYDDKGVLIEQRQLARARPQPLLEQAKQAGLQRERFVVTRFGTNGNPNEFIASTGVYRGGHQVGVVVIANQGTQSASILDAARNELRITFWIALAISGLLGFVFSEVITRQVKRLSRAALAMAGGDFNQRLPRGRLPDEIGDLAESFNRMAAQLGEAFSAIQGQEREIATVVESMAEGVVAVDGTRIVRLANPVAARLLAVEQDRFVGRHVEEVVRAEELLRPIDEALSGRQVSETVERGNRILLLHGTPIGLAGTTGGAVLLIRDITEQKRWEQAQREFIANASHEMRTPIAALRGFIELLEGGAKDKPEVRDEFLGTMQAEVDRLQRLVADLFTLAQLDSGRMRLEVQAHPVQEIAGDVVAVMGPLAEEAGVHLDIDLGTSGARVLCDRDRTVQVLMGFVDNALKHSRTGDSITVWARPEGTKVSIGVRDTGPGIPRGALSKIFDRFYRVGDDPDLRGRGAGLGLAIAKEIVEAHASRIRVESGIGAGSDFSFTLDRAA